MRGVVSVITVAYYVVRSWMMVDHRSRKTMYRLRMSMRDVMSIKRDKPLIVVVHILEERFVLFFHRLLLIVRCFVCLMLWRVLLSRHG